ncbi:hypothetical protein AMS68_001405 [Peltaster fructicola]|uniref:G-protein coupled receptors family 2 profile 2 domain-containing protein n=1 Tax=Peltaster fructicola TaxID=286661 RepID=A0A6H0XMN7_9PEZI|nr:hypothetical protein AMS68_001405 [Peltaster fructicola]
MSNSTLAASRCPAPFLDQSLFPSTGGFVDARLCMQVVPTPDQPTCCLPCPATDWLYPNSFKTANTVAEWLNVFGLVLLLFMLTSYVSLPVSKTRSHYLSTCLVLSIIMVCIGFIIPLAAPPDQCYNAITPNDMYSSMACAWSGAFLVAGGLCTTMWITLRAVSMNLQICWDIIPGRKFLYVSQTLGWGIPAVLFVVTMLVTGVSYRFGSACHVNHKNALGAFWIPLLVMVGIAIISQVWTFAYCVRVYLKSLWGADAPNNSTNNSSGLPTYNASLTAQTTRAVFQRLKKVLFLQWRGLGIVSIILVDVIFFAIVFVRVDKLATDALSDFQRTEPWVLCLVAHANNKDACTNLVNAWLVNVETIEAVLFMFALAGLQCFLMMVRPTFFTAWYDLFKRGFSARQEFVSLDAESQATMHASVKAGVLKYERGHTSTTFEMQKPTDSEDSDRVQFDSKSPMVNSALSTPDPAHKGPYGQTNAQFSPAISERAPGMSPPVTSYPSPPQQAMVTGLHRNTPDYFGAQQRHSVTERSYNAPAHSFSAARSPSSHSSVGEDRYDPRGFARGGLGLHPPSEASESQEDLRPVSRWHDGTI